MQTLSDEQRKQWDEDGYLTIEGVLDQDEVALFNAELDRIRMVLAGSHPMLRSGTTRLPTMRPIPAPVDS